MLFLDIVQGDVLSFYHDIKPEDIPKVQAVIENVFGVKVKTIKDNKKIFIPLVHPDTKESNS